MKSVFIIPVAFFLAACGAPTPVSTATSTPTASAAPTASATPTPFTPAEYVEVYKYLDQSFALETGTANAEGVREIMTTNQLGEKVTVATVDANGNVEIGDVLKYKPVSFDELPPQGEAINQLPTLEQVKQGLFRDNTLLNVEIPEFDADTVLPEGLVLVRDDYLYKEGFTPDPNKPLFEVLSGYYLRNEDGSVMPALTVAWVRGMGNDPAIITAVYREKETLARVMNAVNTGTYPPLPHNTVGMSIYYTDGHGRQIDRKNPLIMIGQDSDYVEAYEDWAEDGIPPEFTPSGKPIIEVGSLPIG
jgi:hypothetical protein